MKKILLFAVVTAAILLASCQKEGSIVDVKVDPSVVTDYPVFTATISPGTKTTVDAQTGKVFWESTDEITITDRSKHGAVYKIESIDGIAGKATFKYKSGAKLGEGPYSATYGTAPAEVQIYNEIPGRLYMTAQSSTNSLTFTIHCVLVEVNLTKDGEYVKSIAVTGIPTGGSETTYILSCTEAQSIASSKAFYIAVPTGVYNKIVITDSDDKVCTLTASTGITVSTNHIPSVILGSDKLNFKSTIPDDALPGVFSVGESKKVRFSKGNLVASIDTSGKPTSWKFAQAQYAYVGENVVDTAIGRKDGAVTLFGWSTSTSGTATTDNYGIVTSGIDSVYFGNFYDWGKAVGDGKTWRTLTTEEWQYLLGNSAKREDKAFLKTVCGKENCLILLPDDYPDDKEVPDEYDVEAWAQAEADGLVCLPLTGYREGSEVKNTYIGYYWSSSKYSDDDHAYSLNFYKDNDDGIANIFPNNSSLRRSGLGVRLVTEVK